MKNTFRKTLLSRSVNNPDASVAQMVSKYFNNEIGEQINDSKFCASTILSLVNKNDPRILPFSDLVVMCFSKLLQDKNNQTVGISMMKDILSNISEDDFNNGTSYDYSNNDSFNFSHSELSTIIDVFVKCPPQKKKDSKISAQIIQNICCLSEMASNQLAYYLMPMHFLERQRAFLKDICKVLIENMPVPMSKHQSLVSTFINFDLEPAKIEIDGVTPTQQKIVQQEREKKVNKMFGKTYFSSKKGFFLITTIVILVFAYFSLTIV